jgi:hypothetical protein
LYQVVRYILYLEHIRFSVEPHLEVELFSQTNPTTNHSEHPTSNHITTVQLSPIHTKALIKTLYLVHTTTSNTNMPPPQLDPVDKRQAAREVIDILQEISDLLVLPNPTLPTPTNQ